MPHRAPFQVSLRGLLLLMAVIGIVLGAWNWRWEEELPDGANRFWAFDFAEEGRLLLAVDDSEPALWPSRITATFRTDWSWRKVPTGLVRGYNSQNRKLFEASYDVDGRLTGYRVFNEVGQLSAEGGWRGTLRLTRTYTRRGTVKHEQWRDRQGVRQGRFIDGTEEWILLDGYFELGTRNGPWREVIGEQNLLISERWDHGERDGEWRWTSLVDQHSYTTEYREDHLVSVNGASAPTQAFMEWLRRNLERVDGVIPTPPYEQQSPEMAYIVLDLADDAGMRWFEIQFPCGTIGEVEEVARREGFVGSGAAPVTYKNLTAEALLELAMRCDLVLDASGGRLIITPRSEWCGSRTRVNLGPVNGGLGSP